MADKIFCGSGRIRKTKFGDVLKISFSKADVQKMIDYFNTEKVEFVNLEVKEKKEPAEGKPTHYLEIDTWKPSAKEGLSFT